MRKVGCLNAKLGEETGSNSGRSSITSLTKRYQRQKYRRLIGSEIKGKVVVRADVEPLPFPVVDRDSTIEAETGDTPSTRSNVPIKKWE